MTLEERRTIARLRNCILALAKHKIMLFDTTIQYTFDASLRHKVKEMKRMVVFFTRGCDACIALLSLFVGEGATDARDCRRNHTGC